MSDRIPCVYCLHNEQFRDEQILLRGRDLYLCSPRGQLVEGYLAIAPYAHIGSLAALPDAQREELTQLKSIVTSFYETEDITFYEQGRGGGGAEGDEFPLHAHLCSLPIAVDLHGVLAQKYAAIMDVPNEPYLYVESSGKSRFYVARSEEGRAELEHMRLKPLIATLIGKPERGYWRDYPGDEELQRVIQRFASWRR